MAANASTLHASAILVGPKAALIRGPAGSGKSRLVWDLIQAAAQGTLPFARLVADDRAFIETHFGRLLVRPAPTLTGLIEMRGLGIRRVPFEPVATVGLVIDLAADDATRHPCPEGNNAIIGGVKLPRLAAAAAAQPLTLVIAFLRSAAVGD